MLYISPGLVPRGLEVARDKFTRLSGFVEREIFPPVWVNWPKNIPIFMKDFSGLWFIALVLFAHTGSFAIDSPSGSGDLRICSFISG